MQLALDVREALAPGKTGKGQWSKGFTEELLTRGFGLTLLSKDPLPTTWKKPSVREVVLSKGPRWHFDAVRFLRQEPPTVYVSPTSFIVPAVLGKSLSCIPIVHDLIAFKDAKHEAKAKLIETYTLPRTLTCASAICTVSDATKSDLLTVFPHIDPDSIHVIFAGPLSSNPPLSIPDGKTILCAGTLCPRKNQLGLIRAFQSLPRDVRASVKLILVGGRGWNDEDILDVLEKTENATYLGHVGDEEYEKLLSQCTIFALPSFDEGFGLGVLDALQRGIPVLTTRRGSLSEVAGDAALYVDPEDVSSIAKGLEQLLSNASLCNTLRAQGREQSKKFSWKMTVDRFLEVLESHHVILSKPALSHVEGAKDNVRYHVST